MYRRIAFALMVASTLALGSQAAMADNDCDRLAGDPNDPLHKGIGVAFDDIDGVAAEAACNEAVAADPKEPRYRFQLGRALDKLNQVDEAKIAYGAAFEAGYAIAAQAIGKLYELGVDGDADYDAADRYYRLALDKGFKFAAGDLAYLYQEGLGHAVNKAEAARLYTIAADAGDPYSQINLGLLYENGDGVPKDEAKAFALYRKAADQGDSTGQFNVAVSYDNGTGVDPDPVEALRWYRRAADQDYALALLEIGRHYAYAEGVAKDMTEAEKWWQKAIDSEDEDVVWQAKNELAWNFATAGIRLDEAKTLANEALEQVPDDDRALVLDSLGLVEHKLGNELSALTRAQEAVKIDPAFAPYIDRLGDIYAALGKMEEAKASWRTALALDPPDPLDEPGWSRDAVKKKLDAAGSSGSGPTSRDGSTPSIGKPPAGSGQP